MEEASIRDEINTLISRNKERSITLIDEVIEAIANDSDALGLIVQYKSDLRKAERNDLYRLETLHKRQKALLVAKLLAARGDPTAGLAIIEDELEHSDEWTVMQAAWIVEEDELKEAYEEQQDRFDVHREKIRRARQLEFMRKEHEKEEKRREKKRATPARRALTESVELGEREQAFFDFVEAMGLLSRTTTTTTSTQAEEEEDNPPSSVETMPSIPAATATAAVSSSSSSTTLTRPLQTRQRRRRITPTATPFGNRSAGLLVDWRVALARDFPNASDDEKAAMLIHDGPKIFDLSAQNLAQLHFLNEGERVALLPSFISRRY